MAKIERYEGATKLSTEGQGVRANPQGVGLVARQLQDTAQQIAGVNQRFQQLNNLEDLNKNLSGSAEELNQIELEALQDGALHKNLPSYEKRVAQVREKYGKSISDPETRLRFQQSLDSDVRALSTKLSIHGRKTSIAAYQGSAFEREQGLIKKYITAQEGKVGEIDRLNAVNELNALYDDGVKIGAYTPEEAAKAKENFSQKIGVQRAMHDMESGALPHSIIAQKLATNDYGIKDPKVLLELEQRNASIQTKREKAAQLDLQIRQSANAAKFVEDYTNGAFNIEEVFEAKETGNLNPETAVVLDKLYASFEALDAKDDAEEYSKLRSEYFSLVGKKESKKKASDASFEDLVMFQNHLIDAHARGAISKEKFGRWQNTIKKAYEDKLNGRFDEVNRVRKSGFDWFGLQVERQIKDKFEQEEAKLYLHDQLMKRLDEEEVDNSRVDAKRMSEITQEIFKDFVRIKHAGMMGAKEVTNGIANKKKGVQIVYEGEAQAKADRSINTPQKTTPDYKVGDTIDVGGKKFKVAKLSADGNHDLEPVNDKAE